MVTATASSGATGALPVLLIIFISLLLIAINWIGLKRLVQLCVIGSGKQFDVSLIKFLETTIYFFPECCFCQN